MLRIMDRFTGDMEESKLGVRGTFIRDTDSFRLDIKVTSPRDSHCLGRRERAQSELQTPRDNNCAKTGHLSENTRLGCKVPYYREPGNLPDMSKLLHDSSMSTLYWTSITNYNTIGPSHHFPPHLLPLLRSVSYSERKNFHCLLFHFCIFLSIYIL